MRATFAAIAALLVATAFLLTGTGLLTIMVSVRAGLEGFPTLAIGAMSSAYYTGFVIGCLVTPYAVRRVGHIRAFAALAATAACVALIHGLAIAPASWIPLRGLVGICAAGLYMLIESWLNERATKETRGRILSTYMMVNLSALATGQMILSMVPATGFEPFSIAAICISFALVPVALTGASAPAPIGAVRLRLARLYRHSPVGTVGCMLAGFSSGVFWGMLPAVAAKAGMASHDIAIFMSVAIVGGAIMVWPLGWLSDRVDRRAVIAGGCAAVAAVGVLLTIVGPGGPISGPVLGFLLGTFMLPLYSLCVSHANDFIPPREFVEAGSGLLLLFGFGAAFGPLGAATLMNFTNANAAFAFISGSATILAGFAIWRMSQREALPPEARPEFTAKEPTTPAAFELHPRANAAQPDAEVIPPETPLPIEVEEMPPSNPPPSPPAPPGSTP